MPKYLASKIIRNEKPSASVNYTAHISKNLSTLLFFDSFKNKIQRIYPEKLFCKKLTFESLTSLEYIFLLARRKIDIKIIDFTRLLDDFCNVAPLIHS